MNNIVGGSAAGAGNIIAAGTGYGITGDGGNGATIQGNFIGTDASATLNLGNADGGVVVAGSNWTIGGANLGEGNVIAHNGTPYGGIVNGGYQMARIRRNRIFGNTPLGIDLYASFTAGVTPNDAGDGDTGRTVSRTIRS